ncbi:Arylsulfatase [Pontiella desulfatans]|uniref:Arylsulfatase n=1 Tax=Pontiella desulfatans TaxID=2750659 RepID=A0A6C2U1T3_PONDE|nr:sulfatase [Pontiella desulfatans]SPS73792.1 sulfatase S1_8 [Kiritimatiellales bacterium]VGO13346.1 Arylsulfatase [Pontiella desulfatans]
MMKKWLLGILMASVSVFADDRPNILWIYAEDINAGFFSCYGSKNSTPHIDKLAGNGVRFEKCFVPSPVCSASRSALITGMMPTTIGVHNHHSSRTVHSTHYLPEYIETLPELFREAGYHVFNHGKDDYNFMYRRQDFYTGTDIPSYWYTWEGTGSWKDRKEGQPFFGQINVEGGKASMSWGVYDAFKDRSDPAKVDVPPYYPDHPVIRKMIAETWDCARITDNDVAGILAELEKDGLLDNTIVFFFADHGFKGPRHKQFCYDGGLHVPLIISNPRKEGGEVRKDMVSSLDVSATCLALAGIPIPEHMESRDLFAEGYKRDYVISTRDRCDFTIDRIRSVRTEQFKYIRNCKTDRPLMQANYRESRVELKLMRQLHAEGRLTPEQDQFWQEERMPEELYDLENDPHEIHNLVNDPEYKADLETLRAILDDWIKETDDQGQYPENPEDLRYMMQRWGDQCTAPEYEAARSTPLPGSPEKRVLDNAKRDAARRVGT